jgi:hypothetical protein
VLVAVPVAVPFAASVVVLARVAVKILCEVLGLIFGFPSAPYPSTSTTTFRLQVGAPFKF